MNAKKTITLSLAALLALALLSGCGGKQSPEPPVDVPAAAQDLSLIHI